ncbi:MAG: T9SS type A sorting domain-containing protein [Bacteroidetes bacterium]|nr:T9SS type A sorting domain-containing protein [Bacteroidota bacterium]HET6244547.1 T9SS type A sorting domain-containing protein [Bacteroidia bacterium]
MKKNYILFYLLFITLNSNNLFAAIKTWTGNSNSNWNTTENWLPSGEPASGDDIIINSINYTGAKANPSFNSTFSGKNIEIWNSAVLTITGGTLTFTGTLKLNGSSTASPLIDIVNGTFTVNGTSSWLGHSASVPELKISEGKSIFNGEVLSISGAAKLLITVIGGELHFNSAVTLNNSTDRVEQSNGIITLNNTFNFVNKGIFNSTGGLAIINGSNSIKNGIWNFYTLRINPGKTLNQNQNISIGKDWVNQGIYLHNNKTVTFNGNSLQTISGSSNQNFGGLSINNTSSVIPQIILEVGITINNNLELIAGCVNQNESTVMIGTSETNLGSLSYTSGWFYGGNFNRWFDRFNFSLVDQKSHFPVGSNVDYRPFWFRVANSSSTGGTITVRHYGIYPSGIFLASHTDPTWGVAPGTPIKAVSKSYWNVLLNGFAGNGNFEIRYGGEGFGINELSDIGSTLINSVVGIHASSTSANVPIEANRTGLLAANISNNFHLSTANFLTAPLPVELLTFTAKAQEKEIKLNWATASETNSDYFLVERSQNGLEFLEVEKVKAAGNYHGLKEYTLIDDNPLSGVSYYRLKQVDFDGTFDFSNLVAVKMNISEKTVAFYPNPIATGENGRLFFQGEINEELTITITDFTGSVCFAKAVNPEKNNQLFTVTISENLSPGLYLLTASGKDFYTYEKLLVK